MEQLFIKTAAIEKIANMYLDRDSTTWVKSIITEFLSQYPQLQNQPIGVRWTKKDTSKGYAVGTIGIMGGSVPIIVNNYQVSPFDIIMFGNATIPLTPETLQEIMTNNGAFRGATNVQPKTSLDLFGDSRIQFSPTDRAGLSGENEGLTRDAVKVASFIDKLEHVDKESVHRIFKEIKDNNLYEQFEENGTSEVLEKLSSINYMSKETDIQSFLRELEIDRQFVYEDEKGNKLVKLANSKVDHTWVVALDPSDNVENIINSSNVTKIAAKSCSSAPKDLKKGEKGHFEVKKEEKTEKTEEFEVVDVKHKKGLKKSAFLLGMDGTFGLFVDENGNYGNVPIEIAKQANYTADLEVAEPQIGDYGAFMVDNTVTKPFTVIGIQKTAQAYEIKGQNIDGITTYMPIRVKNSSLWVKENEKLAYFVPNNAYFIKLAKHIDDPIKLANLAKSSNKNDVIEVTVLENLEPKMYTIVDDDTFDVNSGIITKTAEFVQESDNKVSYSYEGTHPTVRRNSKSDYINTGLNKTASLNDTLWDLIHRGASERDVTKIAALKIGEEYKITNNLEEPAKLNDIAKVVDKEYSKYAELSKVSKLLVKEAAVLKDKTAVDAVLSLGLMKKYNILEYIQLVPDYERVIGELAKLLIMTRLGLANINEVVIKTAMESLTTAVTLLKQLQKINK
jgi:hypothetical protein